VFKSSRHYYIYLLKIFFLIYINYFFSHFDFQLPIFRVTPLAAGVCGVSAGGVKAACACVLLGLPTGLAGPIGRAYSFVCGLPLPLLAGVCNCVCGSPVCALTALVLAPTSRC